MGSERRRGAGLRVLQAPREVAGQVSTTTAALRLAGVRADAYFVDHPFAYARADQSPPSGGPLGRRLRLLRDIARVVRGYDVVHYHGASMLREGLRLADARLAKRAGLGVAVQFWGSDARIPSVERARNPHYVNTSGESDAQIRSRLRRWAEVTDGHVLFADHSFDAFFAEFFTHVHVVGHAVDVEALRPRRPSSVNERPLVVHAPSNRRFKGSEVVEASVARLRAEGLDFDFIEVTDTPFADAVEIYHRADLVVDQVRAGAHGLLAAEVMALGKPVVCWILPELWAAYPPGLPVISANPDTLDGVLRAWLTDPGALAARGLESREYAERVFDRRVVASRLREVYLSLPAARVRAA